MTTMEFENLKKRIEVAKQQNERTKGAIDQIKEGWKNKYGFDTIEAAQLKIQELESIIATQEERKKTLEEKLMAALPAGVA